MDRAASVILRYTEVGPPRDLRDWIEGIAIVTVPPGAPQRQWRLIADRRSRLWLPLTHDAPCAFAATALQPRDVATPPAGTAALVRFAPWTAASLARIERPEEWWTHATAMWRIHQASGTGARLRAVVHWLRQVLPRKRPDARAVMLWRAVADHANADTAALARVIGTSARTLRRIAGATGGCTVRTARRVERFRTALRILRSDLGLSWTDAALAAGYCDQSHLCRAFRRLAGMSPGRFFGEGHHHLNDVFARSIDSTAADLRVTARGAPTLRSPEPLRVPTRDRRRGRASASPRRRAAP